MAIVANFEELIMTAFKAVADDYADLSGIATPRYWHELSNGDYQSKGGLLISATCEHYNDAGNGNVMANPGLVELTAVTNKLSDTTGASCRNIIGAARDMVAQAGIVTLLNATDRLFVYANGVNLIGASFSQTVGSHHMIGITVAVRFTATALA